MLAPFDRVGRPYVGNTQVAVGVQGLGEKREVT